MKSDSFFWQLLKKLPDTLFALLGMPLEMANDYRFDSVELKKSYRLDGLFASSKSKLPIYVVEVQFRRSSKFYANLFAKVFTYLEVNDPGQDWIAVAIFPNRKIEPKSQPGYRVLLESRHVRRVYLDELQVSAGATPGLKILQLVSAPKEKTRELVSELLKESQSEVDCGRGQFIVELVEELLMRRFTEMSREEIRRMFQLHDLKESKVWQEAHKEGQKQGKEQGLEQGLERGLERGQEFRNRELIQRWLEKGKSIKEIAELLEIPSAEVRRLSRREN